MNNKMQSYLLQCKQIVAPTTQALIGVLSMREAPEKGWLIETLESLYYLPEEIILTKKDNGKLAFHRPSLREIIIKQIKNADEDNPQSWLYSLERVQYIHQVEQLTREVTLECIGLTEEEECDAIDKLCKAFGYTVSITSKAKPLTTLGTNTELVERVCDWGIMPTHKQGREFRSLMKNAIPYREGAVDDFGILKNYTVAFCDCALFSGLNNDQPCCDMIVTTPKGREKAIAEMEFDSSRLLTNYFDGVVGLEEYVVTREISTGVTEEVKRVKGKYILDENCCKKFVSPHAIKCMEFCTDKDLCTEDGVDIDLVLDIRSVASKGAWSLALASHPCPKGKDVYEHLNQIWNTGGVNIYADNGMLLGKAYVFTELFALTKENSLMVGSSYHEDNPRKHTTLRVRPEAYGLSQANYDPYKEAIEPHLRDIEDYAALYAATMPIKEIE